jgi:hypothetical protein
MKKSTIYSLIGLSLISGNLTAANSTVSESMLAGRWVSNCRYLTESDPTDPVKGTYQKIFWNYTQTNAHLSVQVSIHDASDKSCKLNSIYVAKAIYKVKLEGDTVLPDKKKVTRMSGKIIGENDLFDMNMREILYFDGDKIYTGGELAEGISGYPEKIDESLYFSKQ